MGGGRLRDDPGKISKGRHGLSTVPSFRLLPPSGCPEDLTSCGAEYRGVLRPEEGNAALPPLLYFSGMIMP